RLSMLVNDPQKPSCRCDALDQRGSDRVLPSCRERRNLFFKSGIESGTIGLAAQILTIGLAPT
ncbi:MAG: hypothetical protein KJ796_16985, partial [Alphaproteobacteria bacterium]|nr:hypothetical protein [Alphaproteobacteria bacterium]